MISFLDYKVILWDFDGVIMDSMPVRDKGFTMVLSDYPKEQVDLLMDYHRKNAGLSRYVKFRYFFEQIRKQSISEQEINRYAESFSLIMRRELTNSSLLIQDSITFIQNYSEKFQMHVVSGSDENELNYLCEILQISKYFKSLNGSPTAKTQLVKKLIDLYFYKANEILLVGDSVNDYEAAISNGVDFAGYNSEKVRHLGVAYILNFKDLIL